MPIPRIIRKPADKKLKRVNNALGTTMLPLLLLPLLVATIGANVIKQPQVINGELQHLNLEGVTWEEYMNMLPRAVEEDAHLSFVALVKKYNYPIESHYVTTPDGYILNVFRIPYGQKGPSLDRPIAFLQHGLLSSADDWITPGPEKSLGYILADKGYDVWFGNARGNKHSRNHTTLDHDNDGEKFWDFSWNEIGTIDIPAMIDYVLEKTGQESLFHIGHSQGTTTYYVMTSERPEYNKKIRAHFSLAPIAFVSHMTSPLFQLIAKAEGSLDVITKSIGMNEFLPTEGFLHKLAKSFCTVSEIMEKVCANAIFVICGFNPGQMNYTLLPIILGHTPAGSSTKQFVHYAQEINSGKFRKFDYKLKNSAHYKSMFPPAYDLSKITAPLYMFYSGNDWLSGVTDVEKFEKQLKNVKTKNKFLVEDVDFNHMDYLFGIHADTMVYNKLISLMTRH